MPPLTFHPEHQRHLGFEALAHCPRHYKLNREVALGQRADRPKRISLLIGMGADALVGELWRQRQQGEEWNGEKAFVAARMALETNPEIDWTSVNKPPIMEELRLLARDYIKQHQGIRNWDVVAVHPYEDGAWLPKLILPLPVDRQGQPQETYLVMPDMLARIGGVLTLPDQKTSVYPYNPLHYDHDMQMLTYCFQIERAFQEPVQYVMDYMQRPSKKVQEWTLPVTYPFPFDEGRRELAKSWLNWSTARLRIHERLSMIAGPLWNHTGFEAWPRDPSACRTWYGRCEWEGVCFGGEDDK